MMFSQSLFALGLLTGALALPAPKATGTQGFVKFTMEGNVSGGYNLNVTPDGTSNPTADATSIKTIIVDSNYDAKDKCTFNDVQFRKIEVKAVKDGVLNLVTPQPIGTVVCK